MARLLSSKKSTYGSPYAYYTVDVSLVGRTPTTATLLVEVTSRLQYGSSYILTGKGYGLVAGIYAGGEWHEWTIKTESISWRGTANHTSRATIIVTGLSTSTAAIGLSFRVLRTSGAGNAARLNSISLGNISVGNVAATYTGVKIDTGDIDQTKATVTLSAVPASVGYTREIIWYNGSIKIGTSSISASSGATSFSQKLAGLLPNTDYAVKAVIYGGGVVLSEKSITVSTPQETGNLTLKAQSTYVTATVSGMFDAPNYTRTIEVYAKKSADKDYAPVTTIKEQGKISSANITGLISNMKYDVKVIIKNGKTVLKTLEKSIATIKDSSLIPTARIEAIVQKLGTKNCIVTWIVNKAVAGTTYIVQAKPEGDLEWTDLIELSSVQSPIVVVAKAGNINTVFRISSENELVAAGTVNYSDEYEFYVCDDFVWDLPKAKGTPFLITANEWNRLREYAISRNRENGTEVDIKTGRAGDDITAQTYNIMKNAISKVSTVGIADKKRGEIITAADIDALRVAINKTT